MSQRRPTAPGPPPRRRLGRCVRTCVPRCVRSCVRSCAPSQPARGFSRRSSALIAVPRPDCGAPSSALRAPSPPACRGRRGKCDCWVESASIRAASQGIGGCASCRIGALGPVLRAAHPQLPVQGSSRPWPVAGRPPARGRTRLSVAARRCRCRRRGTERLTV